MELGLAGRVAIVTGATKGIGRQIAFDLAAEGCRVVLTARSAADLEAAAAELERRGAEALVVPGDLAEPPTAARVVEAARGRFGQVDVLVNNAGLATPKRILALSDEDWRRAFELNFFSAARLSAACVPFMAAAGWGRIVNVASTNGREPDPYFAPYAAAKAALINLTKTYALAFSGEGVLTSCVVLGITATEMVHQNAADAAAAAGVSTDEIMARMLAKQPIAAGRIGQVHEVSAAVLFLASERASWITGAALAVDGGTLRSI